MRRLRRFLPSRESIQHSRWLRWIGPTLHHPRLWHLNRHGLALGLALGVFFGLLIPLAQIPLSVAAAVALRANVPAAVASTLVTNPVTFGPLYYAAWRLGRAVLGTPVAEGELPPLPEADEPPSDESWWQLLQRRLMGVGKPLLLGLALMASAVGLLTYFVVSWVWVLKVRWERRRRLRAAANRVA
jgi:uncharacterized protein (DUF2062 family)